MKCTCCDVLLTDYEATIRDTFGHTVDLCLDCLGADRGKDGVDYTDRLDLRSEGFITGDYDESWD